MFPICQNNTKIFSEILLPFLFLGQQGDDPLTKQVVQTWTLARLTSRIRVSVQGVKSLGGHFACLCPGFEVYEVIKKSLLFFKKKIKIFLHF